MLFFNLLRKKKDGLSTEPVIPQSGNQFLIKRQAYKISLPRSEGFFRLFYKEIKLSQDHSLKLSIFLT